MNIKTNVWANWTWVVRNEKGEEVLELEDMVVLADVTINKDGRVTDLAIIDVKAVWASRDKGLVWRYDQRDLPVFMRKSAIAAAISASGDSRGLLYTTLSEKALESLDL